MVVFCHREQQNRSDILLQKRSDYGLVSVLIVSLSAVIYCKFDKAYVRLISQHISVEPEYSKLRRRTAKTCVHILDVIPRTEFLCKIIISELSITAVCTGRNTLSDRAAKIRHSDLFA